VLGAVVVLTSGRRRRDRGGDRSRRRRHTGRKRKRAGAPATFVLAPRIPGKASGRDGPRVVSGRDAAAGKVSREHPLERPIQRAQIPD
jgi:hypothetical protein